MISQSQINLSWGASTDPAVSNAVTSGVSGYRVERCEGSACTNFVQISTPTTTSFSNTTLTAGTTYQYRIRAIDGAGNVSPYSSVASGTTPSVIQSPAPAPSSGLIAHWSLDEGSGATASDYSGNGRTGTLTNSPAWTTGKYGNALSFDGVNDHMVTTAPVTTATNNWSMSLWVKPSNINQYGTFIHNGNETGSTGDGYTLMMGNGTGAAGNKLVGVRNGFGFIDSGYTFPSANTWYHLVMLRDAGTTKFYVNGTQTANTSTGGYSTPTIQTTLGNVLPSAGAPYAGAIDEVRAYSRVLSQSEILSLSQGDADTTPPAVPGNVRVM